MQNYWLSEQHKDDTSEMAHNDDHKLPAAEQEFANALMAIAKKYGKLANGDGNGIWVGYVGPAENDNASIGVMCSNCSLYAGGGICKIVKQKVQDGGYTDYTYSDWSGYSGYSYTDYTGFSAYGEYSGYTAYTYTTYPAYGDFGACDSSGTWGAVSPFGPDQNNFLGDGVNWSTSIGCNYGFTPSNNFWCVYPDSVNIWELQICSTNSARRAVNLNSCCTPSCC